jgi:hypothetical protein
MERVFMLPWQWLTLSAVFAEHCAAKGKICRFDHMYK